MTVAELIAKLQALPAELPVYLEDWSEGWVDDGPMGDGGGAVVMPPRDVFRRRIVVGRQPEQLPERVVIVLGRSG